MNSHQFFDKVALLRQHQKDYFATRSRESLQASLALEREIDAEIARVNNILANRPQTVQGNLFEQS